MASDNQPRTGQCLCGSVKFKASGVDINYHICHCSMCRKWSGGPAMAVAVEGIEFDGDENITVFKSSEWAERGFCHKCGTHLFYHLKEGDKYMVENGLFEHSDDFKLAGEIFIDNKPDNYEFAGDHSRMTEQELLKSLGIIE